MVNELFADGVSEITVTGPTVRIDLVSLSATERDANNNPRTVFRQRIVMPVDSFVKAFDLMQQAVQGLLDAGVVSRSAPPQGQPSTIRAGDTTGGTSPRNGSPNFN
jgi:hypothetical protein